MLSLALGARRKARGDSASWPRQCATSSMRPVGRQHRVRTTPVPAKAASTHQHDDNAGGTAEAGAGPVNGGVREHSRLEEYARSG
jgi:hypothetical protein